MQCFHCGREVQGTTHGQTGYRVDYYLLHTGHTHWEFFLSPKTDAPSFRYLRLTEPTDIITCVQCYARPEIRQRLDDDFAGHTPILDLYSPNGESSTEPNAKG